MANPPALHEHLHTVDQWIQNIGQEQGHGKGNEHVAEVPKGRDDAPEQPCGQGHAHDAIEGIRSLVENHQPSRGLAVR